MVYHLSFVSFNLFFFCCETARAKTIMLPLGSSSTRSEQQYAGERGAVCFFKPNPPTDMCKILIVFYRSCPRIFFEDFFSLIQYEKNRKNMHLLRTYGTGMILRFV